MLLEVNHLNAFYENVQCLYDISLKIEKDQIVAIFGVNGAGKTTLTKSILHTLRTEGEIHFNDQNITKLPAADIVRKGIAYVPDHRGTFANMTVEDNLRLGAITRNDKVEIQKDIKKTYERFPVLKKYQNKHAGYLSGGEQQMLAIARALLLRPKLLIVDEPSNGLSPVAVENIFKIMVNINKEDKIAILLVEQNTSIAMEIASYLYLMESGRITLSGTPSEFASNPYIQKSYLGV
jgi:branched-chain amino acid transport system ATP-binding protein